MSTDSAMILLPGDRVYLPMYDDKGEKVIGQRMVEVTDVGDGGVSVKWFLPDGRGPFFAVLPHGSFPSKPLVMTSGLDAIAGQHTHFMNTHPDFTGKYREF